MAKEKTIIIGAGIGGLVAAALLAARGEDILVLEQQAAPGGKMRRLMVRGKGIDGGPTVFTMRGIFDAIFDTLGTSLERELKLKPLSILARHAWSAEERLDLHADLHASADAIGEFAGVEEAKSFLSFSAESKRIYNTLKKSFIESQKPNPISMALGNGITGLPDMMRINPFETMWRGITRHFKDPRLQQLFGRYATYCGSSPFEAVATLMLIAHVEQEGVWSVEGGMHEVAQSFARLAMERGARLQYQSPVKHIRLSHGAVTGVTLKNGEEIACDRILFNGDANALATGLLGDDVAHAGKAHDKSARSLSAVTWAAAIDTAGFPLARHNVFFSRDYKAEFDELSDGYPSDPTIYICAQDRDDSNSTASIGHERLLILVNSPANGDGAPMPHAEIENAMRRKLNDCGLALDWQIDNILTTTPHGFAGLFPATGGALYGRASHGWLASFQRPGAATKIKGLYLAGGSTHPGPGVPMAALSGRLAAERLLASRGSMRKYPSMVIAGGTSTR